MRQSRSIIVCLLMLLIGSAGYSQESEPQDTLLIIDSVQQAPIEETVEVSDFNQADLLNTPPPIQVQIPDTLIFRKVSDSIAATLRKQKAFEYANDQAYWVKTPEKVSDTDFSFWQSLFNFFNRPAVRTVIYLLLIGLAIFLVIKVVLVNNLYIFKSSSKKQKLSPATSEALLMEENLDELINDAMARNDQRAVVRFHYLKTLKLLDRKGWITFHPQTTNHSYRSQVNNYAKGKEFGFLISAYEHVWYGNFQLSPRQFEIIVHNFNHFQNSLKV